MNKVQILVPPPAVLKNGEPDAHGMNRYFNWMADHGVDGLFINGSTGEFTRLTDDQKVETLRIAKESVGSRMYLIAGAITGSADLTCRLAARYKEYGADAIKVLCPSRDFDKIVESCPVPVVMAGGPKGADILEVVRGSIAAGGKGCAIGRNVYQSEDPASVIKALRKIVHGE